MNSEEWKERLPLIQAYIKGETIQYYTKNKEWCDISDPKFTADLSNYRIKPKDKYRSFKDEEGCFNKMLDHYLFGRVKSKKDRKYNHITSLDDHYVYFELDGGFLFDWIDLNY